MARKPLSHGDTVRAPAEPMGDELTPSEPRARRRRARSSSPPPGPVTLGQVARATAPEPGSGPLSAAWSGLKLLVGVAVVVGLAASVAWGAHRYAVTTSRFAIRAVDVQGAERLKTDRVARLAGADLGANIFTFDPEAAELKLLTLPWIREAKVARQLPSTVAITLTENDPTALLALEDRLYLVTRSGEPFKELEEGDPYDLPVVTGLLPQDLARDRTATVERVKVSLEVLRRYAELLVSRVHPAEEVHLTPEGGLILSVGQSGISLHLGKGPWAKKLLMAERVLGRLAARGQTPGIVFLYNSAHPERVVVRMR